MLRQGGRFGEGGRREALILQADSREKKLGSWRKGSSFRSGRAFAEGRS